MSPVTRIEIAETVRPAFSQHGADRSQLLTAAAASRARPEILDLLGQLPDRRYSVLNELWEHLGHVPVEV